MSHEPERRRDVISREEFDQRMGSQERKLERIETALFAEDENNDFGQPGIVLMMREMYQTRNAWCQFVGFVKRWALPLATGAVALALTIVQLVKAL